MNEYLSATKYNRKEITLVEKIKYILLYGTKKMFNLKTLIKIKFYMFIYLGSVIKMHFNPRYSARLG